MSSKEVAETEEVVQTVTFENEEEESSFGPDFTSEGKNIISIFNNSELDLD